MPKRNNREPAQPTTRSKRQPRHHHGTVAANPQAQSAPIPIDPVAPTQTTTSLLSSEQLQQVSQAMADILGQNRTQPMPIEPLQPGMGTQPMPIESLQPSMVGHDQCTVDVCDFLADMKKLKDFTTCRQCKQGFDNDAHKPYLLPCLDAICESCIKAISYMKDVSEKQGLTCNECHCTHTCFQNGQLSLQVDSTRRIASEILRQINGNSSLVCEMCTNNEKVLHRCIDCYLFICAECAILHSTIKPLKSHTLLEIKGLLTDDKNYLSLFRSAFYCPVNMHEKELLKMYCLNSSCMKPVCGMCCITTHKDHVFYNIAEAGNDKKTKIRDLIANVSLKENQAQKYVVELQKINDKYVQDSQQLQNEIKTLFGEAKNALEQRKNSLCDDVAAILNDKQECIEKERQKLAFFLTSCKHASYYLHISPRINDQHSFIDIAKSIQLQLKNLKSQEIGNQISMDIMKFVVNPSYVCFTTSIYSYGKILSTKVIAKESKVIISPVCEEGKETQFEIHLFSSTGKPIVDEKVYVDLKHEKTILKTIQCVTGKSSIGYIGIWIPDQPRQLSWTIFSNGMKLDTLEGGD